MSQDVTLGWGKFPFRGQVEHYLTMDPVQKHKGMYWLQSACGITSVATDRKPLLPGSGRFDRCKTCERSISARAADSKGDR